MDFIIYPPKSPVFFHFFGFPVRFYGIILTFSIFLGMFLAYRIFLKKYSKNDAEIFLDSALPVVISSMVGARIFYIFGSLDFYLENPYEIIMINHGGLSIFGAILFGLFAFIIYAKVKKIDILKFLDVYALVMPLSQSIGRFGNYFNQEAFGAPCDGFLKLYVDEFKRPDKFIEFDFFHPAFLYESALNFLLFIFLTVLFFRKANLKKGTIFYLYLIFYSIIRIFVENIRIDSVLNVFNFPVAEILSFFVLIFAIILFLRNK